MIPKNRFIVDTNIIISQLFWPASVPGKAFRKALSSGILLVSEEVLEELTDVIREHSKPGDAHAAKGRDVEFDCCIFGYHFSKAGLSSWFRALTRT